MTTIKSCTDISQSKILAKILALESADMYWDLLSNDKYAKVNNIGTCLGNTCVYAWSLSALLSVLPYYPTLNRTTSGWRCDAYNEWGFVFQFGERSDNPVDACVNIIIKLKELNKL